MSAGELVAVHSGWRLALPWLPAAGRPGRILVGPDGQAYRIQADGRLEPVIQGATPWFRSIASDPSARADR